MATQTKRATTARQWRSKKPEPIELPSGNMASVRTASMEFFLASGFIPNSLKTMVQKQIQEVVHEENPREAQKMNEEIAKVLEDEDSLKDLIEMYDKIAIHCFIDPKLSDAPFEKDEDGNFIHDEDGYRIPVDIDERNQELLYVDEIEFEDKVFVFQLAVGGTKDIESFRQQQNQNLESVRASAEVGGEAE